MDLRLNTVKGADALKRLARDWCVPAFGNVAELAAEAPAEGERDGAAGAFGIGEPIVPGVAVNLTRAAEAG